VLTYWAGFFSSLKGRGGRDINKMLRSHLERSGRSGQSGKFSRPQDLVGLTTPSATLRWLRGFFLMPQPPLLFREGKVLVFASLGFFLLLSLPAFAHHGNAAYDEKTVTVKGTVTEWRWTNPHTFLKFDAKDEQGNVVHWIGEWNNPSTLINFGITIKSFKVGEEVTVTMRGMAKSGASLGRVSKVVLSDGRELSMGDER
jgi:uncharacterized protein DUF6152